MNERVPAWIRSYGIRKLARQLGVGRVTVNSWINSVTHNRKVPRVEFIQRIVLLSRDMPMLVGALTYDDFFGEL